MHLLTFISTEFHVYFFFALTPSLTRFFYTSSQLVLLLTNLNNLTPSANFGSSQLTPFSRSCINLLNFRDPRQELLWRFSSAVRTTIFLLYWSLTLNPHKDFPSCGMAKSDIVGGSKWTSPTLCLPSGPQLAQLGSASLTLHSKPHLSIPVMTSVTFLPCRQEIHRYSACLPAPIPHILTAC